MHRTEQSLASRVHGRILNRASAHLDLASEQLAPNNPMAAFDAQVANACIGIARLVSRLDRSIDHETELDRRSINQDNQTARN